MLAVINVTDIYISTSGSLFLQINILPGMINRQHFMLANPVFYKVSTDTYKQERFLTFVLADGVYITYPLS